MVMLCAKCGSAERHKGGRCAACENARGRRRYRDDPAAANSRSVRWAKENPEKKKAIDAKWNAANTLHRAIHNTFYHAERQREKTEALANALFPSRQE